MIEEVEKEIHGSRERKGEDGRREEKERGCRERLGEV